VTQTGQLLLARRAHDIFLRQLATLLLTLADLAEITQAEEGYWEETLPDYLAFNPLERNALAPLPLALQRRLVRAAAPPELQLEFRHVESILEVASGSETGPKTYNLPAGWAVQREGEFTRFVSPHAHGKPAQGQHRPIPGTLFLPVPGRVSDPSTSRCFEARRVVLSNPPAGYNPEHLYAPHALPSELVVRTWRFGDRFWPAHTKAPKKLKELFQEKKIAAELRASWPVMVAEREGKEEVVWVQGFAVPASLRPGVDDREAILIEAVDAI
jgi:tRNA(Ile)-lysidine synthetase-like protein